MTFRNKIIDGLRDELPVLRSREFQDKSSWRSVDLFRILCSPHGIDVRIVGLYDKKVEAQGQEASGVFFR